MIWLILAVTSYLLNSVVVVADKFLLSSRVKNPLAYAFNGAALNLLIFLLWPFVFSFLSFKTIIIAFFAGTTFFFSIYYLYKAMAGGEASRVVSIIGGVSPIIIFFLSYFVLDERLSVFWLFAFILLVSGSLLLTLEKGGGYFNFKIGGGFPFYSCASAVFFALTFFSTKMVFLETSFLNGFIWTRIGVFFAVLCVLLFPSLRKSVLESPLSASRRLFFYFASNKVLSALAFLILNYSFKLGSVSLINALQGVQYVFVFFLALMLYFYKPGVLEESFSLMAILQKITGIIMISVGVAILFIF